MGAAAYGDRRQRPEEDGVAFTEAYQALLARWPGPVQEATVPTVYGPTRVNIAGPEGQPPLVLLPGGGATSTAWFAVAKDLVRHRRVYAIDLMGDAGLSRNTGTPLRTTADLLAWLDAVTDHLGLRLFDLGGHSYGGWLALTYALHAPQRIRKLALLDPTGCFAGFSPRYLAHALPLLAKATPKRARKLVAWEARGQKVDEGWLEVYASGVEVPGKRLVRGKRPSQLDLQRLSTPTFVLLPDRSRVHNIHVVATHAKAWLPHCTAMRLPNVSHHSVPTEHAAATAAALRSFLG
jgi:pimeloyl-ACP methyl ester carboxylesterase